MKTAWYLATKKSIIPALLVKIESETVYYCTWNPDKAIKFTSKKEAMEFIKKNNFLKHWKPLEI